MTTVIRILGVLVILIALLLVIVIPQLDDPIARAILLMALGLLLLWVFLCGSLMYLLRQPIRRFVLNIPLRWPVKFVLFATLLAMLEEAVTTLMTNLAPLFGVQIGEAYITASADYFDVILFHSVIVFVPMFITWAWLLSRYRFSPGAVFLLYGITGVLAESLSFGAENVIAFPAWIYVYGLMVYLPAYTLPPDHAAVSPRWPHYLMAVVLPILASIPVALLVGTIHPVSIHFPPIQN